MDYHLCFPLLKTFGKHDNKGNLLPYGLVSFNHDGAPHYNGLNFGLNLSHGGKTALGYSKSDIALMV